MLFAHVEGSTSVDRPATGRIDCEPASVHAQTRLAEERLLLEATRGTGTTPVVLRLGIVYALPAPGSFVLSGGADGIGTLL